jgi:branched-subunit amino acid transport protein
MPARSVGVVAGTAIPASWGLDFVVPLTFLAIIAPALRTLAHVGAALTAVTAVLLLAWIPGTSGSLSRADRHGRRGRDRAADGAKGRAATQGRVMSYSDAQIWIIIVLLGVGTFLIRFSFLGLVGNRELPEWVLRHLRYTAVAILPAMVAPLVLWPAANGGEPDPARLAAAAVTLGVGFVLKNPIFGIVAGFGTFLGLGALLGS